LDDLLRSAKAAEEKAKKAMVDAGDSLKFSKNFYMYNVGISLEKFSTQYTYIP
jgi:hypothetical protein